jgi:hypothetical protein
VELAGGGQQHDPGSQDQPRGRGAATRPSLEGKAVVVGNQDGRCDSQGLVLPVNPWTPQVPDKFPNQGGITLGFQRFPRGLRVSRGLKSWGFQALSRFRLGSRVLRVCPGLSVVRIWCLGWMGPSLQC